MGTTDIVIRLMGVFYVAAGYFGTRAMLSSLLMDKAISTIGDTPPPPAEMQRTLWMFCVTVLVFFGGAALLLALQISSYLFVACTLLQAFYFFVVAPKYFDVHDAPDAVGRRQSLNAFIIYTLATGFVLWAHSRGALFEVREVAWPAVAVVAALTAAFSGYVIYTFVMIMRPRRET